MKELESWTRDDLRALARDVRLPGRSRMTRGQLIQALRGHRGHSSSARAGGPLYGPRRMGVGRRQPERGH